MFNDQWAYFPDISWQESVTFLYDSDCVRFVVDHHTDLKLYSSIKQQSTSRNVIPLSFPDSEPTISLWLYSLMSRAQQRIEKISVIVFGSRRQEIKHFIFRTWNISQPRTVIRINGYIILFTMTILCWHSSLVKDIFFSLKIIQYCRRKRSSLCWTMSIFSWFYRLTLIMEI